MKAIIYKESDSNYEGAKEFNTIEDLFSIVQDYDLIIKAAFDYEKDKGYDVAVTICDSNTY